MAAVAVVILWPPASAEAKTWAAQLRYWPSSVTGNYSGTIVQYNTYFWGFSLRGSFAQELWAASLNFDRGPMNYPGLGAGQSTQIWNLNLHRNFRFPRGQFSLYGGWGSLSYEAPNSPGGPLSQQQQGPRVGADLRVDLPNNWFVTGDLGYGPSGSAQFTNTFVPGSVTVQAQFLDARLGVGRNMGTWGLEFGYRWLNWDYTLGPNTCPTAPCQDHWGGWYLGVNILPP